jgi:uncharacterized protein (TIGR00369 family)
LPENKKLIPNPTNPCFGCGGANENGMLLTFEEILEEKKIRGSFVLGERYQGGGGMAHGGIIALLLDEVMGKVCRFEKVRAAVTAELNVQFLKPVRVDEEIVVQGWQEDRKGRNLFLHGEICNSAGVVLAKGQGRFVVIEPREAQKTA